VKESKEKSTMRKNQMSKYNVNINGKSFNFDKGSIEINSSSVAYENVKSNKDLPNLEDLIDSGEIECETINGENHFKKDGMVVHQYGQKIINLDKASGFRIGD
jgi:hypothetical protein